MESSQEQNSRKILDFQNKFVAEQNTSRHGYKDTVEQIQGYQLTWIQGHSRIDTRILVDIDTRTSRIDTRILVDIDTRTQQNRFKNTSRHGYKDTVEQIQEYQQT